MAKLNFYLKGSFSESKLNALKKSNRDNWEAYQRKPLPLLMYVSNEGKRMIRPIGVSVPPKYWDSKSKRVKFSNNLPEELRIVNNLIIGAEAEFIENFNDSEVAQKSKKEIQKGKKHENFQDQENDLIPASFSTALKVFLSNHKNSEGFELTKSTESKYKCMLHHFEAFCSSLTFPFNWQMMTLDQLKIFHMFLYDKGGLADNTATKYIKALKTFFRFWRDKGLEIDGRMLDFKVREYAAPVIVLELGEIEMLRTYIPNQKHIEAVKDVFVFMSWTGQRYSDISRIEWKDISTINGIPVWMVTTKKTKDSDITIPLNEIVCDILEKYKDDIYPIPRLSEQYFNRSLKELALEAGLVRKIRTVRRVKGIPTQDSKPLYEVISSHIARKTFITNSLILGLSETEVKRFSGHKDDRSFRRYVELGNSIINRGKNKLSLNNIINRTKEFTD